MSIRLAIAAVLMISLASLCVVTAADASPVWVVNSKTLKSGETDLAVIKFGTLKIRWEDRATGDKFEVECKKSKGEATLKGGFPGKDEIDGLTFEECALVKAPSKCKLTAGATAEELPGWPTELVGPLPEDVATGVRFGLSLSGCEKSSFNKGWTFKGMLKAGLRNEAGKVKLKLPTLAGGGEILEVEGDEGSLSGEGELEEKSGGTLAAEEARARWLNESGERLAEGVKLKINVESVGNTVLAATIKGVEVEIVCATSEAEGWVENPTGGESGKSEMLFDYKRCTMPKPGGTCKIHNELFRETNEPSESGLVYKGSTIYYQAHNFSTLAMITIEGCADAELNATNGLTGKAIGELASGGSVVKFTSTSGSTLKFAGAVPIFTAEDVLEMEGGGKIEVG